MSMSRRDRARLEGWKKLVKRAPAHHRQSKRRSPRRKKNSAASAPAVPAPAPNPRVPFWAPSGADLEAVPAEVRQVIPQVIEPAYEQFVLHSTDGLERWIGNTLVHLLWLETLHQLDLKREYGVMACIPELARVQESEIARQLRLIESKMKIGKFLLRIRETRQRLGELACWPVSPEAPSPASEALSAPPSGSPKLEDEAPR